MIEVALFKRDKSNLDSVVDLLHNFVFASPIDYLSNSLAKSLFLYPEKGFGDFE